MKDGGGNGQKIIGFTSIPSQLVEKVSGQSIDWNTRLCNVEEK